MIRRPPRSTQSRSSAASDVYKRQVFDDAPRELHERREAAASAPADPPVEGFDSRLVGHGKDRAKTFLEQVRPVKFRVGGRDPGQLDRLVVAEVLGVLP